MTPSDPSRPEEPRRTFLSRLSGLTMAGGLVSGYGAFAHLAGRFLYPAHEADVRWWFVTTVDRMPPGSSISYKTPRGAKVTIARSSETEGGEFRALSGICPHLGCQVHWEAENKRFFCPCHNGAFDALGVATAGPPKDAGQSLSRYPVKVQDGSLFIGIQEEVAEVVNDDDAGSDRGAL